MTRTIVFAGALFASAVMVSSCAENQQEGASESDSALMTHEYVVRGEVVALPDDMLSDFKVRHEAIPEYRRPDGKLGMDVMSMPFWPPVGMPESDIEPERIEGFSLEGIEIGDKVAVTFEVRMTDSDILDYTLVGYYATRVEKLPADTELDFTPLPK
ncbi:MAG: hypothetical protein AAFX05_01595 [Planctomycetota bacterium]